MPDCRSASSWNQASLDIGASHIKTASHSVLCGLLAKCKHGNIATSATSTLAAVPHGDIGLKCRASGDDSDPRERRASAQLSLRTSRLGSTSSGANMHSVRSKTECAFNRTSSCRHQPTQTAVNCTDNSAEQVGEHSCGLSSRFSFNHDRLGIGPTAAQTSSQS